MTSRVAMALMHGLLLQRVAFGLDDVDGLTAELHTLLRNSGLGPA